MSHNARTTAKTALAVIVVVLAAAGLLLHADVPQVPSNAWAPAGDMTSVRAGASGTLLSNGLVLVAGGIDANGATASVERFSPDGAHFIDATSMQSPRANHTATLLADGRVLVAGGTGASGAAGATAEIYDSSANVWLPAGSLNVARRGHTATLLPDGKVLIAGGDDGGVAIDSLEIFDPATALFTVVDGASSGARTLHAAAALLDGRVLIAGGFDGTNPLASTSIYDPATNTVSAGPDLSTPRSGLTATTLLDGRVLVAGGAGASGELASAEIFDPATTTFTSTDNSLSSARQNHLAFLLPHNNQVLIVGGLVGGSPVAAAEYFTPWGGTNGTFCSARICASGYAGPAQPATARAWAAGSALSFPADATIRTGPNDGLLVLAGGSGQKSAELFGFATVKTDKEDYAPGTTVTITGSGWQPGESVALTLVESPLLDTHPLLSVTADNTGNIVSTEFVPDEHDVNVRFYLTAYGASSQAQTTFTDGEVKVQTNGPTVAFTWSVFTGSPTCGGVASSSGSVTTGTVASSVGTVGGGDSIQLGVPATAAGGGFVNWTGTGGFTTSSSNPLCMAGVSGGRTLTANYAPVFSINDVTANEGNSGTTTFTFTVTRTAGGSAESVHFSTANGTAVGGASCLAGVDYVSLPDTKLNFGNSVLTNTIDVTVCGDTTIESDETFFVNLTTASAGTIGDSQGVGTITNDDTPANTVPSVAFTTSPGTANEGDTKTYNFSISDPDAGQTFTFVAGFPDCGTGGTLGSSSINTVLKTGTFQCSFPDGPANPTVRVQVQDSFSTPANSNIAAVAVVVSNVDPTIAISGASNVDEGSAYSLTLGAVTDPGTDTVTSYVVHWGDGATDTYSSNGVKTHTYADGPNSYGITVDLVDEDGTFLNRANALSVTVDNVAPTIAISGAASVNEGSLYSLTLGAVTDPGTDTVTSYIVHWGDGASDTFGGGGVHTHTYADGPNSYGITVDLVDEDGTFLNRANALSVTVNDVAPTIAISGASNVNEGSLYNLTLGAVTDPGPDTVTSYIVHWGDGASDTYGTNGVKTHTYADGPNNYSITVDLVDEDGTHLDRANPFNVTVDNVAPTIAISGASNVDEGASYSLTLGAVTDPGTDTVSSYVVHWGDGNSNTYASGGIKTHTYADGPNSYAITVDLTDEDGTFLNKANPLNVSVDNVAPTIAISGGSSVNEGSSYSLTLGAVTDPGTDTVTSYIVHWGDGGTDTYSANGVKTHTYVEGPNSYSITVDLTDEDGTFLNRANAASVTVNNVAPSVTISSPTAGQNFLLGAPVPLTASCTDPGTIDTWTAKVNWGDGGGDQSLGAVTCNSGSFSSSHTYLTGGSKTIVVTVTDDDAGAGSANVSINILYQFIGFLQPIDNLPIINVAKSGQTIPTKWQLKDADGHYISDLATFQSLLSAPIACSADPASIVDETVTATGGTVLRYDSVANQFIYNWQTSNAWKGTCRLLQLTLSDGTVHYAKFQFNK